MEIISSRQNPNIKNIVKLLGSAKYRLDQGLAVADGIHLVQSLLQNNFVVRQLVLAESALDNSEIIQIVETANVEKLIVRDSLHTAISDVSTDVGVLAVFDLPESRAPEALSFDAVLLENIQDPGNVGTILRTAAAAGVQRVYLSTGCASVWSPKVLRAGMGAQFSLEIFEAADLAGIIRTSEVPVLATSLQATESIYNQDLRQPTAWLFGNEGQGISVELESLVSKKVIIPQAGSAVESLNVAVATAICLYEQLRQRMQT